MVKNLGFEGLGFRVQGSGFKVWGYMSYLASSQVGFTPFSMHTWSSVEAVRIQGSGLRFWNLGSGLRVQGSVFRVQGSGFRVQGFECWVQGSVIWIQGLAERFERFKSWLRGVQV